MAKDVLITPASGSIEVKNDADALKVTVVAETVTTANKTLTLPNKTGTLAVTTDVPNITGAASTVVTDNLTASRAVVSNASGKIDVSTVTSTELGYVSGVTSAIQTQLNGKQATLTNPVTGTGTANLLTYWTGTNTVGSLATTTYPSLTELSYVKGVTSALQTQIDGTVKTTGNQTIAGVKTFSSQITSNLATGTSPLSVSSTTVVTNLNADLIDGIDSSRIVFGGNATKTTNISNLNTPLASGFYDSENGTGNPTATWYSVLNVRHNNTDNNYGFQFAGNFFNSTDIFYRSLQGSNPTAVTWNKIWHAGNDGAGSTLDADLLDGQQGSYFLDTSGSSQTKSGNLTVTGNISSGRYYQSANGIPTSNLGSPTVTEMALFDEQFDNKTAFYPIANLKFYTSTDNITFTEYTTPTDTQKRRFLGGDGGAGITIPNLTPYFRIEVTNANNYVFLNALYMYWASQSHSTTVKIRARRRSDLAFIQWTNSSSGVSAWPGHLYMPFSTIPWLTGGSSSGHYDIVHIDFQPTWSGNALYGTFPIVLDKLQLWGGYPASKRNIYSTDENRNVAFPATLTGTRLFSNIATGTSPLSVTSTTVNTNLNADLVDGLHSSSLVQTSGDQTITGTKTFSNDVIVTGNLTINGTTTNINTTNLVVEDKNIVIGDVATPTDVTADGGGITLKGATDKTIIWVDSTDRWTSNQVFGAPNYVSTVATGTQPYATTSTTVNTNLNADLLDGLHASAFVSARTRTDWNTATSVISNVVGELAWKNYGNNHTIFDASNSTTPSGTTKNNTNPDVFWTASYPTLMGWNGTNTYGVRVDSARVADTATTATSANNIDGIAFRNGNSTNPTNPNNINENGIGYITSVSLFGQTDGALYSQAFSTVWNHHIFGDYRTGSMAVRGRNNGTLTAWRTVWDSGNDGAGSGLDADLLDGLNSASTNTASTIVARDASGNFSAGAITGTSISVGAGASTWTIDDNTANVLKFKDGANTRLEIKSSGLHVNGSATALGSGTVTGVTATSPIASSGGSAPVISVASGFTIPTSTEKTNYDTAYTGVNTATNANTVSTIVKRDASGNFSAGTITASLTGTASGNLTSSSTLTAGNLSGTIPSAVLGNSTVFIGSTSVALNRATGTLALTGVTNTNWDSAYTHSTTTTGSIHGSTTVGGSLLRLGNPGAITFLRVNADNTVTARSASDFRSDIGAGTSSTTGTVTSVGGTGTVAGLTLSGTVTTTGNLTLGGTLSTPVSTINDSTTVGQNLVKLANPSAIRFIRINANNTVDALTNANFRTAIGAGTGNGTVTSVTGTSPVASSGGTAPAISLASGYGDTQNPYASKTQKTFLAAPNGANGVPTFRTIAVSDVPTLNQNTTGSAGSVANSLVLKFDTGTTEGTDLYTFNGSSAKTVDFKSGTNVTLTDTAGVVTFSSPSLSLGTTSGSGNAVTDVSVSGHTVTMTKGSTFLTAHPTITMGTNTTNAVSPAFGQTFTAIDSVTKDGNGHVTLVNTKTVTIPTPSYPTVNNGILSWTTSTAGATNTTISASLSGAYSANTATNRTMSLAIGPALTNLATLMTGAGTGIIRKTGADTYEAVANTTYLTGNQSITLSGDVSGSGATAITTTLANSGVTAGSYTAATVTVDAKGRLTSASSNTIPTVNNGTLTLAVSGTGLSGSASFTANQSTASTFTVTSNATSANTASTIVARDVSGNFNAGAITGTSLSAGTGASTWTIDDATANVLTFKDGATTRLEIKSGGLFVNGSTTALGTFGTTAGTYTQGNDARLSDARTPLSHTHGNILNDGTITATAVTIETGDRLLITNNNNSQLIERGIDFGTSTTSFLANNGTWITPAGGGNVTGPASAVSGRVATFNGTTGKIIQDGGTLLSNLVSGPASSVTARIATFNGTTGKLIQDSGTLISGLATSTHTHGNITNAGAIGATSGLVVVTGASGVLTTEAKYTNLYTNSTPLTISSGETQTITFSAAAQTINFGSNANLGTRFRIKWGTTTSTTLVSFVNVMPTTGSDAFTYLQEIIDVISGSDIYALMYIRANATGTSSTTSWTFGGGRTMTMTGTQTNAVRYLYSIDRVNF
jgi:hypothetical protein